MTLNNKLDVRFKMVKLLFISLTLISLTFFGCKTETEKLQEEAIKYAEENKRIDEREFSLLKQKIAEAPNNFKNLYSDNKIDDEKLRQYLIKIFNSKKINIPDEQIWEPFTDKKQNKYNFNIYLENSASMDGYVAGITEFETAIYDFLSDIKISRLCDQLNLYYINTCIPFTRRNALPDDIQDFIEKLEPSTFRQRGGDRAKTDIKNILHTVLNIADSNNIVVLISDCVFSPGKNKNAQEYLVNQSIGVKIDFSEKIKNFDLNTMIIQLKSNFTGKYYDRYDNPVSISTKRPYYIWIIGNKKQMQAIIRNNLVEGIKGGYENKILFSSCYGNIRPEYKILKNNRIGEFRIPNGAQGPICEAERSKGEKYKGLFSFYLAVDYSKYMQDTKYFLDTSCFKINSSYRLQPEIIPENPDISLRGYSHKLKLSTNALKDEDLLIEVIFKVPGWVYLSTSDDDTNIANDINESSKTFGLKYLVEGVFDAYNQSVPSLNDIAKETNKNVISSIKLSITK